MRECSLKIYKNASPRISLPVFQVFASDPPKKGTLCAMTGKVTYLYTYDQIRLLIALCKDLKVCLDRVSKKAKACHTARKLTLSGELPVVDLHRVVRRELSHERGIRCRFCGLCGELQQLPTVKLQSGALSFALRPQILPPSIPPLGTLAYRFGSYAVYVLSRSGRTTYTPVLDRISVLDRLRGYRLIKAIRAHEKSSMKPPFSIELGKVLEERRAFLQESKVGEPVESFIAYASVGLLELLPLLTDEEIGEFYVDSPCSFAYIDHRELGRCDSSVWAGRGTLERFLAFSSSSVGRGFDYLRPSLRASIRTRDFHIRVSSDIPPLSFEGASVDVRKFFNSPIDIKSLVDKGTLTREAASFLLGKLKSGSSFTIYGESGSGKTTLAIALDLETPSHWRKYSIESDIAENVSQRRYGKHQVRLLAATGTQDAIDRRRETIDSLLHKSPDYVFFGEVLSPSDSQALFQLLASGIKCIHTVHAGSGEALLKRFVHQHRVPVLALSDLGVLIQMRRFDTSGNFSRRLVRISEIARGNAQEIPPLHDLFLWDDGTGRAEPVAPLEEVSLSVSSETAHLKEEIA
ncbi:MAG: ATPase, T2SS/T4P/T4SS family [Candidatus Verstraetearchaeota archaeon]|nr:ATPase, T2SS/T4P/T4SS family [Candidatus Verstraetearchaeota archaeon]